MNKEDLRVIEGGLEHNEAIKALNEELELEELKEQENQNTYSSEELEKFYENNKQFVDIVGGMEVFETMLSMNDEEFTQLAPSFFQLFNEMLHESRTKNEMLALMSTGEWTIDQLDKELAIFFLAIDEIEELSQIKKDFFKHILTLFSNTIKELGFQIPVQIPCELNEGVELPTYAHDTDAGLDIYAQEEYTILPGETKIIPTGIKVAIPDGYAILIQPRSGQSVKTKLRIANTPGLIDSGYRDEIGVIIENIEPPFKDIEYEFDENGEIHILHGQPYTISKGQRFAQMRLVQVPKIAFVEVESVGEIGVNRNGGFGSSGI